MNREQVQRMLTTIEAYERRAFPEDAVAAWLPMFAEVAFEHAMRAVREWFDVPEPPKGPVGPGPLRRRALEIARTRGTGALAAIEAAREQHVPPNAAYRAARAALDRRQALAVA